MKKTLLKMLFSGILMMSGYNGFAQAYLTEMYGYTKVGNIIYDTSRSVNILYGQVPNQQPIIDAKLRCDIYKPTNSETKRPLIIIAHTGSFLPPLINRQTTGNKDDSAMVELCTRFAKRGYVVVAMNYRVGWNAASTVQLDATEQLLKATYRGIQDVRNCIRYMRANATAHGIDTSKIIVGGQGTGGYIALALGSIDKKAEIEGVAKFQRGDFTPMVSTDTLGDWMGLGGTAFFNTPGQSDISADAHMVFNFGGAMGHLDWLESNSLPVVSMQSVTDPFAPYNTGNVIVPTTGTTVIPSASGAGVVIPRANSLGVNAKANAHFLLDNYSRIAHQKTGQNNLYPFYTSFGLDGAPWEWWDRAVLYQKNFTLFYDQALPASGGAADTTSMMTNPNMSAAKGKAYIDTIVNFLAPRIALQFDLVANTNDVLKPAFNLTPGATTLNVTGDSSQKFVFAWVPANTTGFANLTYTWKLSKAATVDFAVPVASLSIPSGTPLASFDYTTLSGFMGTAGVAIGDTANFKWTVEADFNGTKLWSLDTLSIQMIRGKVTAVKEITNVSQYLAVYPNPANDIININVDNKAGNVSSYRIMDVTGRELVSGAATTNVFSIDVNALNTGIYFVHITLNDGSIATKRVLIQ